MMAPLRPKMCSVRCSSRISFSVNRGSRPRQSGAITLSMAALTTGTTVKPKLSPHPTSPLSVVTLSNSESTVLRSLPPHAPASDLPPTVKGMRRGIASIC